VNRQASPKKSLCCIAAGKVANDVAGWIGVALVVDCRKRREGRSMPAGRFLM